MDEEQDKSQDDIPHNYKVNIERRFLDDLDDYEWHVAHLRGAQFDGRRDCMEDTFADKVRRYRKMLKNDGARVEFVSSDPIEVDPADITQDSCRVDIEQLKYDTNVTTAAATNATTTSSTTVTTPANVTLLANVTVHTNNVPPTSAAPNLTSILKTTATMSVAPTTPKMDLIATTLDTKQTTKAETNQTLDQVRRASEYMFSSIEYYDDSIEFDESICPEAVEAITLDIDQLRSYDLECEMTLEWRSLE